MPPRPRRPGARPVRPRCDRQVPTHPTPRKRKGAADTPHGALRAGPAADRPPRRRATRARPQGATSRAPARPRAAAHATIMFPEWYGSRRRRTPGCRPRRRARTGCLPGRSPDARRSFLRTPVHASGSRRPTTGRPRRGAGAACGSGYAGNRGVCTGRAGGPPISLSRRSARCPPRSTAVSGSRPPAPGASRPPPRPSSAASWAGSSGRTRMPRR